MDGSRGGGSVAAGARPLFHRSRLKLAIAPSAVRIARRWTADQLARATPAPGYSPLDVNLVAAAVLVVSDFVTNAIRAVSEVSPVRILAPGRVPWFANGAAFAGRGPAGSPGTAGTPGTPGPMFARRDAGEETGRGLTVVAALAENWGWCPEPPGKSVWSELAVTAGHADSEAGG